MKTTSRPLLLRDDARFSSRHNGLSASDQAEMLALIGFDSMDAFIDDVVPGQIRMKQPLKLPAGITESEALDELGGMAARNQVFRSFIGMGYYDCHTPTVVLRNVLENPAWYTAYTPYQAEIAQGRLEALLNFQTVVSDLTGLPIANASLLDEGTSAAEGMAMCHAAVRGDRGRFLVAADCHPQTIAVVRTRAASRGWEVVVEDAAAMRPDENTFGVLVQYPTTDGAIADYRDLAERAHAAGALVVAACDLLALTLLTPPGEWGADVAVGSTQRLGVPMGYGGPHAAFFATKEDFKRQIPGRIIGVSRDAEGRPALRMALQTREQHIRREKATSNVCTAQVLLAVMASMYAVYHGPAGLRRIAERVHNLTLVLAAGARRLGWTVESEVFFDTIRLTGRNGAAVAALARDRRMNLREYEDGAVGIALDETVTPEEVGTLLEVLNGGSAPDFTVDDLANEVDAGFDAPFARTSKYMEHPVFNTHRSETEMLRYIRSLEEKDLSLVHSMIALGSCTMKLNATTEMLPITMSGFAGLHPFAPVAQAPGYTELFERLEGALAEITGFAGVSLQPNAGSQGEFAGLQVIKSYHDSRGEAGRNVCLIPQSAHGTNPASAVMAGMKVVVVKTDPNGNIDVEDLRKRAAEHSDDLAALMVTYPSTHGVFEEAIRDICAIVHEHGGQVYMDGANMNAMVGIARPGDIGADVCHLNLHKTFCIPHGGGGPGVGPIGVASHLLPYLPNHPEVEVGGSDAHGPISSAPWGSASILPISYTYIRLMGAEGLTEATKVAILNANYVAHRLSGHFDVLYRGRNNHVAHECIVDTRPLKASAGVEVEDIAKRLMDYGFHAPTVSFPVAGTLMIEPTESESRAELDRFCDALISIREEVARIERGELDKSENPLTNAPHTMSRVMAAEWNYGYSREEAAFPAPWVRERKFWPAVSRVESAFGDRNLVCTCPPVEAYE
ncbi:MAG TPA: aminomethyl-transferring glycine dehydrogenase [Gemmatimonadales bacterium]|nr:aminomethyl-transferring glycine dehydrogenase [Gemmatimonadales bacterium]